MITPISTKILSADGFQWNQYSPRVATITNKLQHFATVVYFQFYDWSSAHAFWKSITDKRYCYSAQVREAEQFNTGWECKVWGMPQATLEKLIERDRTKSKSRTLPLVRRDWSVSESHDVLALEAA